MKSAIFKIMPAAGSNFSAVNYNEKKVKQGKGGLVHFENFGYLQDKKQITKDEFKKYLKDYSARNNKIKNPVFHATCSCKGKELDHGQLKEIALEIMENLGYKENPVLIYEHHDTDNNHIHIVTSRVGENGKKIKDSFEGKRANQYLNAILKREPHQEFSRHLNNSLSYKFGTQAQFALLMELHGYRTQKKDSDLLFFKHGEKKGEISLADIAKRIQLVENERSNATQTKALIYKYKKQYSGKLRSNHDNKFTTEQKKFESDLTVFLKQKFGLDFIFFTGKDKDKPYGYTIIDHHNREVHKGSDVLKLDYLIKDFSRNENKGFTTADSEFKVFQNNQNLSENDFNKQFLQQKKLVGKTWENTSNNEIQLGDLFEEFIRELEKENDESNGRVRKRRRRRGV